jgi:molybdopterin converting factor small subunit
MTLTVPFRVLLFGVLKDIARRDFLEVELPPGATVREMGEACAQKCAGLEPYLPHIRAAVNLEYVKPGHELAPGDEVALLPPVSGG